MNRITKSILIFSTGLLSGLLLFYLFSDEILNWGKKIVSGDIPIVTISPQKDDQTNSNIPKYTVNSLISDLSNPWDIVFINDSKLIFTERANKIELWENGSIKLLASPEDTYVKGEGGMLGLTIEPDLVNHPYLYACFNSTLDGNPDVRVSRFKFNETLDGLVERTDIVTGLPSNLSGRHSGCQLDIGPDGYLWIGTGDAAQGEYPQDPLSLGGKILRVDRDGKAAPGNLNNPFDPRIYSYGHRNVQGLAFLSESNTAGIIGFNSEHGPSIDDEINPLVPGNFGWNPVPGYNEAVAMTDSDKYPDAILPTWTSGRPTLAASGLTVIKGSIWGSWEGRLALATQKGSRVRLISLDQNGKLLNEEDVFNTYGRIRTIQQDPQFNLYILTDNGGGKDMILKISPSN